MKIMKPSEDGIYSLVSKRICEIEKEQYMLMHLFAKVDMNYSILITEYLKISMGLMHLVMK